MKLVCVASLLSKKHWVERAKTDLCPSGATCLSADYGFSELSLKNATKCISLVYTGYIYHFIEYKKSLKIPKGKSESVYRKRTDNTMAKIKSTKGQTTIYKTYILN